MLASIFLPGSGLANIFRARSATTVLGHYSRLGVVSIIPTAYNTGAKVVNGTENTSDWVDLSVTAGLVVTGFLVSNPIGLGVLAFASISCGIYRIGWGEDGDSWVNYNFGYNNRQK